mgnify:CR=1 FL=1
MTRRRKIDVSQNSWGAHNHSTGSVDRDFGALGDLLEALLGLLRTSLRLSWSPLGVPETSRASKSDAKSLSDANLSPQLAFGNSKINDFHLFFNSFMHIYVFDLNIVL